MPSFDVVSEIDQQEIRNAVDQVAREIADPLRLQGHRHLHRAAAPTEIKLHSSSEDRLTALRQVLEEKLVKRKVSLKALDYQKVEEASGATARQVVKLVAGISKEKATELNKHIKGLSLKGVQSQVQGEQLRVTGKKRDDLQARDRRAQGARLRHPAAVLQLPGLTRRATRSSRSGCRRRARPRGGTCRRCGGRPRRRAAGRTRVRAARRPRPA